MDNKLTCRVCGKEYDCCHSQKSAPGVYRWFDVACCPEHGEVYLKQILASRGELKVEKKDEAALEKSGKTSKEVK